MLASERRSILFRAAHLDLAYLTDNGPRRCRDRTEERVPLVALQPAVDTIAARRLDSGICRARLSTPVEAGSVRRCPSLLWFAIAVILTDIGR